MSASSASFQIPNGTIDVGGGTSSSASYGLTSCVGSEIAGSSSSPSFHIDSGCGATLEQLAPPQPPGPPGSNVPPIPTLAVTSSILLASLLGALAWRILRRGESAHGRKG